MQKNDIENTHIYVNIRGEYHFKYLFVVFCGGIKSIYISFRNKRFFS